MSLGIPAIRSLLQKKLLQKIITKIHPHFKLLDPRLTACLLMLKLLTQRKWNKRLPSPIEDWPPYYSMPFLCTSASKLRSFQYRIFHRTIATNVLSMKMGIKDHDHCFFFCESKPETIEHLFWYCDRISSLWNALVP